MVGCQCRGGASESPVSQSKQDDQREAPVRFHAPVWRFACLLIPVGCQGVFGPQTSVTYEAAEATLDWLEFASTSTDTSTLRAYFHERVASTAGCSAIVRHHSRFRTWGADDYFADVMEAIGRLPSDMPLRDEDGQLTRFGFRRQLWSGAIQDPGRYRAYLDELRAGDVVFRAETLARSLLPDAADIGSRFHIVLLGTSPAFSVGSENGFDLLQLPRHQDESLKTEEIVRTFAHEMHHTGFANASRESLDSRAATAALEFLQALAAEGMATALINGMPERLEAMRAWDAPMIQMVVSDWDRLLPQLPELYAAAEKDLTDILEGTFSEERIGGFWLRGAQGPLYVLGVDMIRTIQSELGTDAAVSVAEDVINLLVLYDRAARRVIERGGRKYRFPPDLVRRAGARAP